VSLRIGFYPIALLIRPAATAQQGPVSVRARGPALVEPLTERELEVLRLIAAGSSNQRIARELVVALDTVKKHVTHVLGKLGAANRTEAAARAGVSGKGAGGRRLWPLVKLGKEMPGSNHPERLFDDGGYLVPVDGLVSKGG